MSQTVNEQHTASTQIQTKQPYHPLGDIADGKLLSEIFKFAAWGSDSRDQQEKIDELLYLAARRGTWLEHRAQKSKKEGEQACRLAQELTALFKKGNQTALNNWLAGHQADPELSR